MGKKIFNKFIFIFFICPFIFAFAISETKAQTNNLPTQAQINAKLARIDSMTSFSADHPEVFSIQDYNKKQALEKSQLPEQNIISSKNSIWQNTDNNDSPTRTHTGTTAFTVTGIEQNCIDGIAVCSQSYTQTTSYTGHGSIQEVNSTCLLGKETNSVWYIFTAQTSGTFGFTLTTTKDYDFALYNITNIGCAGIPSATPVRCNFSATYGNTGMSTGTVSTELPALSTPATGTPISNGISDMVAGQTYALIIDNWSADATGYTLNFGGTSSITDLIPPTINPPSSVVNNCNGTFTLAFSEPVQCSSIAANGSDFTLSGGGIITSATGTGCTGGVALTNSVIITYTVPSSGTYTLGIQSGGDGNTILDKCGNAMLNTQTVTLNVLNALTLTPSVTNICTAGTAVTLTAAGAPNNIANIYTLNPGGIVASSNGSGQATFIVNPTVTTTYVITASYAGCTASASTTITLASNIVVSISPVNPTICSGTTTLTASLSVNGVNNPGATFQWSGGSAATTAAITVGPGSYNVTGISTGGCPGGNTATSTVSLASAGSGTNCNIYYVSPAGGGTGLTKTSPTTLQAALTATLCTSSIIRMQTGIYTFSNKIDVNSYVTIEGGFNSTFTIKTSDMSGGANSTTIRRSNAADSDDATSCSAFKVVGGASGFRIQDVRIEMPGSPNVTAHTASGISNFGIKVGGGCTSYNVVRCYIDAGAGGNP